MDAGGVDSDVNGEYVIGEAGGDAQSGGVKGAQLYLDLQGVAAGLALDLVLEGDGAADLLRLLNVCGRDCIALCCR